MSPSRGLSRVPVATRLACISEAPGQELKSLQSSKCRPREKLITRELGTHNSGTCPKTADHLARRPRHCPRMPLSARRLRMPPLAVGLPGTPHATVRLPPISPDAATCPPPFPAPPRMFHVKHPPGGYRAATDPFDCRVMSCILLAGVHVRVCFIRGRDRACEAGCWAFRLQADCPRTRCGRFASSGSSPT